MKIFRFLTIVFISFFAFSAIAQERNSGQALVPIGDENDSLVRLGIFSIQTIAIGGWTYMDSVLDNLGVTFDEEFGPDSAAMPVGGLRKGLTGEGVYMLSYPNIIEIAGNLRVRSWYAQPFRFPTTGTSGLMWKYIDSEAVSHNNPFDSNDVSPYTEYPSNHSLVIDTFHTRQYNNIDSLVHYGDVGRVILGRSDDSDATNLLFGTWNQMFPGIRDSLGNLTIPDTAKLFSATLEFNLDESNIDTSLRAGRPTDSLPLVCLQILYKQGANTLLHTPGQSVSPFVPFKTAIDSSNPGWLALVDTIITQKIYDTLSPSWRAPDILANGAQAPAGRFKQLHVQLKNAPSGMNSLIQPVNGNWISTGVFTASAIRSSLHPDSSGFDDIISTQAENLIEIRVLSTYRTTVRVRSLTFGDTTSDKFLYRKPEGDSSWSCNPDGSRGGYDTAVASLMKRSSDSVHNKPFEMLMDDYHADEEGYINPVLGYLEYIGNRYGIHMHIHQQDGGGYDSREFRREAVSYGGHPPSMYENESQQAQIFVTPILPRDYVYYSHSFDSTLSWPDTVKDKLMGLYVTRPDTGTDRLEAYHAYTNTYAGGPTNWFNLMHNTASVAMHHPNNRKFAVEINIPAWGLLNTGTNWIDTGSSGEWIYDSSKASYTFNLRPPTPEEIIGNTFTAFANGITSFNDAQAFEIGDPRGSELGFWESNIRDTGGARTWEHNYNVGHRYGYWGTSSGDHHPFWTNGTNDADGPLPNYYVGFSNTFRAVQRVMTRIHTIFDSSSTNSYPLRSMQWLDAYQAQYAHDSGSSDSVTSAASFLKVIKTVPVAPWNRIGSDSAYIDSTTPDSTHRTYVVVGTFKRAGTSSPTYGALVVNTRTFPSYRDTADINYYNAGMDSISKIHSTLGDIDVRKVYMKLDLTKCNLSFGKWTYFVVRDLWHPDSTWLLHKDSTFAVYIKPGDAKFLYFQPGVAVKVASRAGTNIGKSTDTEFCFNNGRRIAEIMHGTRDIVTYTRGHKLYVAYPAIGRTFGGSPDQSSGDNIITGYEVPIDTNSAHFCARPSICVAQNDTGIALTWWFQDGAGHGHIAAAYRKDTASAWDTVSYISAPSWFNDTSHDYHLVTPVLTPVNDTAWLIAAGNHSLPGFPGFINGFLLMTPHVGLPYFQDSTPITLAADIPIGDTIYMATFQSLSSRPLPDSLWPVRIAWQQAIVPHHHDIYFSRFQKLLVDTFHQADSIVNVSSGLGACDNQHPSLATNGTVEQARWILGGGFLGKAKFYHDYIAWETELDYDIEPNNYFPVIRVKHVVDSPHYHQLNWGAFNVFRRNNPGYTYPQISADFRTYDGNFSSVGSPSDVSHDWVRMVYGQSIMYSECWTPNWMYTRMDSGGHFATLPQTTNNPSSWPDSGSVPRSIAWINNGSTLQPVQVTNGFMPWISSSYHPNLMFGASVHVCDTPVSIGTGTVTIQPPTGPPVKVNWDPIGISSGDVAEAWTNPEDVPNVEHTDPFPIKACDSILIPRTCTNKFLTEIQDSLTSPTDYVMFRMKLLRKADSSWLGTIDSMVITQTMIHWAGYSLIIDPNTARYEVPCSASPDSAFVSIEVLRGDTANSINRYYVNMIDSDQSAPSLKRSTNPPILPSVSGIQVTVHPNPSSLTTKICVEDLPEGVPATVEIFNAMGQSITTLYNATPEAELGLCISLDCSRMSSGTYYARVVNDIMGTTVKFSVEH